MQKLNKRIPGILPPPPKAEVDGRITNLSAKTTPELLELRNRQLKLLNNKSFISKLPDKGVKIQALHDKILAELKHRNDEDRTCQMFDILRIQGVDKDAVQDVEWEGEIKNKKNACLDSDDDSEPEDVLHILSQSTAQEKKVRVLPPEKSLITPDDLQKIGEIPHVKYIVNKTEHNPKLQKTGSQFKPYKTTKSNVHNPEKEIHRKKNKYWEVTAATPPPILHSPAKVLSLEESLKLQKDYNIHLKEVEAHHAAEKLLARAGIQMGNMPDDTTKFGPYRNVDSDDSDESDPEGSDKEVLDETMEPEKGGVVFTLNE